MDDNSDNGQEPFRVGKTIPSRPNKLTILALIGIVIGFFVVVLTAEDAEMAAKKKVASPAAGTFQPK